MTDSSRQSSDSDEPGRHVGTWIRIAVGVGLIAAIAVVVAGPTEEWLRRIVDWIEGLGVGGAAVFGVVYIGATVLFVPGLILTVAAGFVFGWLWGVVLISISSTLGALAAFFVGRYLARDAVRRRVEKRPKFQALYRAIEREGFKVVLLTRLVPVFPFNLLNYAYGLTDVSWKQYVLASWMGMLPGTIAYVYVGATAGNLTRALAADGPPETATWVLWGLGLGAVIGVVWLLTRRARAELNRMIEDESEPGAAESP